VRILKDGDVPNYSLPGTAAGALAALAQYNEIRGRDIGEARRFDDVDKARAEGILQKAKDAGREILSAADKEARAGGAGAIETAVAVGDSTGIIVEYTRDNNADLIVMGRRGLGDFSGLLLGSVSHKVGHLTDCACLTVK